MLFRYEHAARNWAYQQKQWYGRKVKVIEIKQTPEGARWKVLVLPRTVDDAPTGCDYGIGG